MWAQRSNHKPISTINCLLTEGPKNKLYEKLRERFCLFYFADFLCYVDRRGVCFFRQFLNQVHNVVGCIFVLGIIDQFLFFSWVMHASQIFFYYCWANVSRPSAPVSIFSSISSPLTNTSSSSAGCFLFTRFFSPPTKIKLIKLSQITFNVITPLRVLFLHG